MLCNPIYIYSRNVIAIFDSKSCAPTALQFLTALKFKPVRQVPVNQLHNSNLLGEALQFRLFSRETTRGQKKVQAEGRGPEIRQQVDRHGCSGAIIAPALCQPRLALSCQLLTALCVRPCARAFSAPLQFSAPFFRLQASPVRSQSPSLRLLVRETHLRPCEPARLTRNAGQGAFFVAHIVAGLRAFLLSHRPSALPISV
jgi:hypothetical protein